MSEKLSVNFDKGHITFGIIDNKLRTDLIATDGSIDMHYDMNMDVARDLRDFLNEKIQHDI